MSNKEIDAKSKLASEEAVSRETVKPEDSRNRVRGLLETDETEKVLIGILKARFESHPERHEGVKWTEVEKSLAAHPEKLAALKKLEETGGEPDVFWHEYFSKDDPDCFVFYDFSKESPSISGRGLNGISKNSPRSRRSLNFDQASKMAMSFGAKLMDRRHYKNLRHIGRITGVDFDETGFDNMSENWLMGFAGKSYLAWVGMGGGLDAIDINRAFKKDALRYRGFRCVLKVPKA
jgi:hypothetical protein